MNEIHVFNTVLVSAFLPFNCLVPLPVRPGKKGSTVNTHGPSLPWVCPFQQPGDHMPDLMFPCKPESVRWLYGAFLTVKLNTWTSVPPLVQQHALREHRAGCPVQALEPKWSVNQEEDRSSAIALLKGRQRRELSGIHSVIKRNIKYSMLC